jgi:outer membrane usher protein
VPVLLENRPIGATNARGNLLVTRLNAYQRNKLSIDPMKLPANVNISRVETKTVPSDRAGTLVEFGIRTVQAASVILHDAAGKPVAVGSAASLRTIAAPAAMVGYDGMIYLEGLAAHNVLDVQTAHGRCVAQFDYQQQGNIVPLIGPLTCREEQP